MSTNVDDLLGLYKSLFSHGAQNIIISVLPTQRKDEVEKLWVDLLSRINKKRNKNDAFRNAILDFKAGNNLTEWVPYLWVGKYNTEE